MYLKKMEIVGFKSFADKTKVEFDKGITAVVGPNGSGKSNIVEALRWVLGEQSAKALRGGKMPDVIFAGTEKRRALNYAEVIAHFDNSDHYLQGQDENEEVVITRRLYRNGDSEFLMNGRKCRLRDIHDLFTDTGLGRDSLSIISQGRIESVFNSKPEERRAIFEEAAGVLKYKNRRNETESKLNSTQDNLDRLEDIIFELNSQLVPLQSQRDTALRFQELEAERSDLSLSVLVGQLESKKAKYDQTELDLAQVAQELASLSTRKKVYDEQVSQLRTERQKVEAEQEKLQADQLNFSNLKSDLTRKIELFDVQKDSSEKSAAEREERLENLKSRLEITQQNLTEVQKKSELLLTEKNDLDKLLTELSADLATLSESPEVVMERLRDEFVQLVEEEAQISNEIVRNKAEITDLSRRQSEQDESVRENLTKFEKISQDLSETQENLNTVKKEIETLLAKFEEGNQAEKKQAELERLAQNKMYDYLQELNQHKARLTSLQNIRESHSNLFAGVRAVMQNASQIGGVIGVVSDLLTFDPKYTTAIDIALGGGSQNVVTEDENAAKRAIAFLREKRLGRATFLPLTTIKGRDFNGLNRIQNMTGFVDLAINLVSFESRLHKAMSSLLGTTVIVDSGENATAIARAMNYNVRIVTLDGTQINPGGSYAGGAGKRNSTTFTSVEISNLEKQIKLSEEQLKISEKEVQKAQSARQELLKEIELLKTQGEEKRFVEQSLNLKIEQLTEQKVALEQLTNLSANQEATGNLLELTKENEHKVELLAKITERKAEIEKQLEEVKTNSQAHKALQSEKTNALNQAQLRQSEVVSELKFTKADEKRLLTDLSALTEEKNQLTALLNPVQFDETERNNFSKQLTEVEERLSQINVRMVSLKFEREDLAAQMEDLEQHNQDFIQQTQELNTKKTRYEMQLEQIEGQLMTLQETLNSEHQISFEEAQATAKIVDDLAEAEQKLKNLERQIKALGPINLDAIAQFDEVNERFTFLSSQKDDLLEAKNLLLSTIDDMNDEVKIRFKTSFDAIRESFKTTFAQMFVGGLADLELTSDNLLEAGVEIKVQPPGKKLSSLNLMSGGEKALTALALIFAILRVRTVPFVVLDEVEAALDEANVKRFGDYMNHFDNSNQFIVVTHRRGTMAAAGSMYGVTMADAGVSKMISVKLDSTIN
ncbi:chromosome segregation protein SMC [Lactococcus lactis]|uniref:Chromosome partition protein Smc n=1 Tax=Lactococcus lactis subsp. lactis TaxID=1360 RepID=A0A2N5WEY0_LACLL|nr:chromosome segregation protein SMC [Lactococcus lactis]MBU5242451.1 chromosome segregation protein SMC [Lactococcus lactis]MDT2856931.1 chromosome segregation protein SMC [Lactococcus lactis]PLW60802.1 Chromosome partition protein Smc [Lactococcus lactis subsp. lactis]